MGDYKQHLNVQEDYEVNQGFEKMIQDYWAAHGKVVKTHITGQLASFGNERHITVHGVRSNMVGGLPR